MFVPLRFGFQEMNLNHGKASMPTAICSAALKSGEVVSDQFPAGLRVLVVDDDPTCLRILDKMLQFCLYHVTMCNRAETALSKLRDNKNGFDIVISDVHMPDMDGFKLLEHIGLEMDLPVIMMSADDSKVVVMKGVTHGACDYLIKPVRIEALKNIWQHVVRRRKNEWKDLEQSGSVEDGDRQPKPCDDADYSSSLNDGNCKSSKRRKDDEEEAEERDDSSTLKKQRVVWSVELHQQFVAAVNQLGIDKAVPKKILELMNVPGLTRENVASHLQKYRLYLRRLSGVAQHPSNLNNSFINPQEAIFGPVSAFNEINLQALAATGKLSIQSLASLQAAGLSRSSSSKSGVISDQRNIFSFENPKLRFGDGQPQHLNSSKPINLLQGIPTTMEAKQLANLNHGSINMKGNIHGGQNNSLLTQMTQPQSSIRQSVRIPGGVPTNNLIPPESSIFSFPANQTAEFPGKSLPLQNAPSKGPFLEESNLETKESGRFVSNYDIFNDLQNPGLNFNASSQGNLNISSSATAYHQSFSSGHRIRQENDVCTTFPENGRIIGQQLNSVLFDNPVRLKAETIPDPSCVLFPENFVRDDVMSTLFRQQQENFGLGSTENDYDFDRYPMDNIHV